MKNKLEPRIRAILKVRVKEPAESCLFSSKSIQAKNCGRVTRINSLKTTPADTSTNTSTKKTLNKIKLTR